MGKLIAGYLKIMIALLAVGIICLLISIYRDEHGKDGKRIGRGAAYCLGVALGQFLVFLFALVILLIGKLEGRI